MNLYSATRSSTSDLVNRSQQVASVARSAIDNAKKANDIYSALTSGPQRSLPPTTSRMITLPNKQSSLDSNWVHVDNQPKQQPGLLGTINWLKQKQYITRTDRALDRVHLHTPIRVVLNSNRITAPVVNTADKLIQYGFGRVPVKRRMGCLTYI